MKKSKRNLLFLLAMCLLGMMMVACSKSTASNETTPEEQIIEESTQAVEIPEEFVLADDMIYPGAEFLFEFSAMGGPMMPHRFYSVSGDNLDQIIDYYRELLPWFPVEIDEILDGHRHITLSYDGPLDQLGEVKDPEDLPKKGSELDGALIGVEVAHSSAADSGLNMLTVAKSAGFGEDIPTDSIIIVLTYFNNPY